MICASCAVSKRLKTALDAGLTVIVCVGETVRDEQGTYLETLKQQIKNSLEGVPKSRAGDIIVAYEPVWAIGAAEAMKPEDVYEMSLFVKKVFADVFTPEAGVRARVLYGGAVTFRNAPDIMTIGKVDGLLVGRESVNTAGFVELLKAVDQA
jgi:triosephosphate isomerase